MTCFLLHIMEEPDRDAYRDPDLQDLVGLMPRFFCAKRQPILQLAPSEALRCMRAAGPCWKPDDAICGDQEPSDPSST